MSVSRSGLLLPKRGLRDLKTSLCFTVIWLGRENHTLVRLQGGGAESPKHPCYLLRQPPNKSPCHLLLGCYKVSTLGSVLMFARRRICQQECTVTCRVSCLVSHSLERNYVHSSPGPEHRFKVPWLGFILNGLASIGT